MVKKKLFANRLVMLLLAAALLLAAGCQAIGGLDFNKALIQSLKVTSSESAGSLAFRLHLDEEALEEIDEEEAALYRLISDITLAMDEVKLQDANHMSVKGRLLFGDKYSIGYEIRQSAETLLIDLEGAKAPFVIDLTSEALLNADGEPLTAEESQTITELGFKLTDIAGGFIVGNLPNPDNLKVAPASETINGESVSLLHASFRMDGKQLWTWVNGYIDALIRDRAGLDAAVKGIIEVLADDPALWEAFGEVNPFKSDVLDAPTTDEIAEQISEEIANALVQLQEELKALQEEDRESLDEVFNESLVLKADLYVDGKLDIRKSQYELSYEIPALLREGAFDPFGEPDGDGAFEGAAEEEGYGELEAFEALEDYDGAAAIEEFEDDDGVEPSEELEGYEEFEDYEGFEWEYAEYEAPPLPFTGFTLKVESTQWKVNGDVRADAPVLTDDAIDADEWMWLSGYEMISLFDQSSDLYALLRDELHMTRQTYYAYNTAYYNPPIIVPGYITIVAVRDVADAFGATTAYDGETDTVEVYDEATDTTIVFEIGSDVVLVNGAEEQWPFPITKIKGSTYVPARKLAETLGANIEWETLFGDWKQLTIEREL